MSAVQHAHHAAAKVLAIHTVRGAQETIIRVIPMLNVAVHKIMAVHPAGVLGYLRGTLVRVRAAPIYGIITELHLVQHQMKPVQKQLRRFLVPMLITMSMVQHVRRAAAKVPAIHTVRGGQ